MLSGERTEERIKSKKERKDPSLVSEQRTKNLTSRNIFNPKLSKKQFSKLHLHEKKNNYSGTEKKDDNKSIISSSQTVPLKSMQEEEFKNTERDFEKKLFSHLNLIKNSKNLVKTKEDKKKYKIKEFEGQSAKYSRNKIIIR